MTDNSKHSHSDEFGTVGTVSGNCTSDKSGSAYIDSRAQAHAERLSGNDAQLSQTVPNGKLELWDVNAIDVALGVGKRIGRIAARSRQCAEAIARANYGKHVLVSPSGGKPRRRRQLPRDLGSTRGDR